MTLTQSIHHYLTTALASHFRGKAVQLVQEWTGDENHLWQVRVEGREAVIKHFEDAGQARGRRQFDAHERFAPIGLAPRPLWFDRYPEGLSRQVLVYEWIEGETLESANEAIQNPKSKIQNLHSFGSVIAQIHTSDPGEVRRFCPHPLNLEVYWQIHGPTAGRVSQWLASKPIPKLAQHVAHLVAVAERRVQDVLPLWNLAIPTPVHGDLKLANAIAHVGGVVLLDWEMYGLGDPALEIAKLLCYTIGNRQGDDQQSALWEAWLDDYCRTVDQSGLEQRIYGYRSLIPFEWLCSLFNTLQAMEASDEASSETSAQEAQDEAQDEETQQAERQAVHQLLTRTLAFASSQLGEEALEVNEELWRLLRLRD